MTLFQSTCLLLLSSISATLAAETILIAVASNFTAPMKEIASQFEQTSSHTLKVSYGSSGKFYAQIQNGAPFHLFFSADQVKPKALEKEGLAIEGSRTTYAIGSLVLWSAKAHAFSDGRKFLESGKYNKLAIANPKLAPYGFAAIEVLKNLHIAEKYKTKWVLGENISQTYHFISTGNADIGFIALSQIAISGGTSWVVPNELYQPIKQDVVLLRSAENNAGAKAFMDFINSPTIINSIESYGYKKTL